MPMKFDMYKHRVFAIFVALLCAASMANPQTPQANTGTIPSGVRKTLEKTGNSNPRKNESVNEDEAYQNKKTDSSENDVVWETQEMESNMDSNSDTIESNKNRTTSDKSFNTDKDSEDSGMGFVDFLLLVVLAICGWLVYKHREGLKKIIGPMLPTKTPKQPTLPITSTRPNENLQKIIDAQQNKIQELQGELDENRKEIQSLKAEIQRLSQPPSPDIPPSPTNPSPPQTTMLYAQAVVTNAFLESGIKNAMNDYTIAIIQLKNSNEGEFRINDQHTVQPMLINNFAFGVKLVTTVRHKSLTPSRIDTIEKGIVKKQGDRWVVVKPALIDLI